MSLRAATDTKRRRRVDADDTATADTGIAVTPRIGIALPSGIRDLSPSTVGRLDLATRRLGHLPPVRKPPTFRAAPTSRPVANDLSHPAIARSKLRTRMAGMRAEREKKEPRLFMSSRLFRSTEIRASLSREGNEECFTE